MTFMGAFLNMLVWMTCTCGADQMAIQRYLSTRDAKSARRSFGVHLFTEVLISFPQAVKGADVEVPGILAPISLRVPAGTQSGQMFAVRGRGLPRVNASGVGDMHVRVQVWTPDTIGDEEKKLLKRLAELHGNAPKERNKSFWSRMKEALGA